MTDNRLPSDELADRLDATLPPNQDTIPAADDDTLVNLALQLARAPRPEMSPETFARIRAQVMDAHQQPLVRRPVRRLQMTPLMRWAAVLAITIFFFGTAMIPAAASSLPGEFLYPLKLGLEQIEVVAAPSPAALWVVHLNHAERRLNEAQILLERGQFESALLLEGWESLAKSAEIAEQTPSADIPFELQACAAQVDAALNAVLQQAEQMGIISPDEIRDIRINVPAADDNADPSPTTPTATPTSSPQPISSPTAMPTATPDSILAEAPTNTPVEDVAVNLPVADDNADQLTATLTPTSIPSLEPSLTPTTMPTATTASTLTQAPTSTPVETSTAVPTATPVSSAMAAIGLIEVDTSYTATVVATRGVNVRGGPGTNFDIIAVIQPGSLVEVIGQNDDESWLYVRLDDDRAGWIAAYLLRAGIVPNSAGDQTNTGDFGCEHPGDYCHAPGYNNPSGNNGDTVPGQGAGNANGGGPPPDAGGGPPDDPGGSSGGGNPPSH